MTKTSPPSSEPWAGRGLLLDFDGTLVHGDTEIPGAAATVSRLREDGWGILVVSNNSFLSGCQMAERLATCGFALDEQSVVTAIDAVAGQLASLPRASTVLVVGGPSLCTALSDAGFEVVDGEPADVVVVGGDLDIDYARLSTATRALLGPSLFVALNVDRVFTSSGRYWPAGGAFVAALSYATGRQPDIVIGKPSPLLIDAALERLGLTSGQCLMVGDSIDTDIAAAGAAGLASALVRTGASAGYDHNDPLVTGHRPDIVIDSIADLPNSVTCTPLVGVNQGLT